MPCIFNSRTRAASIEAGRPCRRQLTTAICLVTKRDFINCDAKFNDGRRRPTLGAGTPAEAVIHVANVSAKTLREKIVRTVDGKSYLMTDELASYEKVGREFSGHETVNHFANECAAWRLHSYQYGRVSVQPDEALRVRPTPLGEKDNQTEGAVFALEEDRT
jgi:hypothetical protein